MMRSLLYFCLIAIASGNFQANLEPLVDYYLNVIDSLLDWNNLHRIPLGNQKLVSFEFQGVYVENLATLERTGPANVRTVGNDSLVATLSLGLAAMTLGIRQLSSPPLNFTNGRFDIGDVSFTVQVTMTFQESGACNLNWDKINVDTLDDVQVYSDNKDVNNMDVSHYFVAVRKVLNVYLCSTEVKQYLSMVDPCALSADYATGFMKRILLSHSN